MLDLRDGKKWYVYQKISKNIFVCGNDSDITNAKEVRFISMEAVLEKDYHLKK